MHLTLFRARAADALDHWQVKVVSMRISVVESLEMKLLKLYKFLWRKVGFIFR